MQMVAASRMRRAQDQVLATRPYAEKAWEVLTHLAGQRGMMTGETAHPLLRVREEVRCIGVLVITSDRGLCGSYNHAMIQRAWRFIREAPYPVEVITVGKRGRDILWRLGARIVAEFSDLPPQPRLLDIAPMAHVVTHGFVSGQFDVVYLAHTGFVNTLAQRPEIWQLLPIRPLHLGGSVAFDQRGKDEAAKYGEYIYEPSPHVILDSVLPRFTELQVYQAVLESLASEHSARMVAMRSATENANELVDHLTLTYNRVRQEAITKEMLDIVGGAEALTAAKARA
jgi:F-type H+-transporting ATPase subunit gamma